MGIYTLVRGAECGSSINQPPNLGLGCSVYGLGKGDCRKEGSGMAADSGEMKREQGRFPSLANEG